MLQDSAAQTSAFGAAFTAFLEQAVRELPGQESPFISRLRQHFGTDPHTLPILTELFDESEHPNLQLALTAYTTESGRATEILGINSEHKRYAGVRLSDLLEPVRPGLAASRSPTEGPVEYVNVELADDGRLRCVQSGLFLISDSGSDHQEGQRLAVLVNGPVSQDMPPRVRVDVMAPQDAAADQLLAELRARMQHVNVYRGHAVSLARAPGWGDIKVNFHRLPVIGRQDIILPATVLEQVERHTIGFARHRETLLAAGVHLKRGLLLHGPPGTGKTLTALYLASQMRDRTVLIVTGTGMGLLQRVLRRWRGIWIGQQWSAAARFPFARSYKVWPSRVIVAAMRRART